MERNGGSFWGPRPAPSWKQGPHLRYCIQPTTCKDLKWLHSQRLQKEQPIHTLIWGLVRL